MVEYQKIGTLYAREEESKRIIPGKYASRYVESLKDCLWTFTEKVDGTNIRVHWDGHTFEFAGRTDKAQIPVHLRERLEEIFLTPQMEEMFEQKFGEKDVIVFGEGYGAKINNGGGYTGDGTVGFIVFDVMVCGYYLDLENAMSVAEELGLEFVPFIRVGTIKEAEDFVRRRPASWLSDTVQMEGVVGVPLTPVYDKQGNRITVKIKVQTFNEIERQGT